MPAICLKFVGTVEFHKILPLENIFPRGFAGHLITGSAGAVICFNTCILTQVYGLLQVRACSLPNIPMNPWEDGVFLTEVSRVKGTVSYDYPNVLAELIG